MSKPPLLSRRYATEGSSPTIARSESGKLKIKESLRQCFHMMPLYGKKDADFMTIVATFFEMLRDYPATAVSDALDRYMRQRREFPTVADIIGILEGRVQMDKGLYNTIRLKKRDHYLSQREEDYLEAYQRQILNEWGD